MGQNPLTCTGHNPILALKSPDTTGAGQMLQTKEHYDLMDQFEKEFTDVRLDRESKDLWPRQVIYQDGQVNQLFLAYRRGYALVKCATA
jgi:hypothetical protein